MADRLVDRAQIEGVLRRNVSLHAYELGDLDDFYWPDTTWYSDSGRRCVALIYASSTVMLYVDDVDQQSGHRLLESLGSRLPDRFIGHFTPRLSDALTADFQTVPLGLQFKMALSDKAHFRSVSTTGVTRLGAGDLQDVTDLYARSYEGNWFDPKMLETGLYFGIRRDGRLLSIAGVHVHSAAQRVAVLGNVATDPEHRGQGMAAATCARLCKELFMTVDHIALDVAASNEAAAACYHRLGFSAFAQYEKASFVRR